MKDFVWIIYIVIMVVGFLAKQAKRQNVKQLQAKQSSPRPSQPKTASPASQNVSVKFEQYFTQLEKAFTTPQPPVLPEQPQKAPMVLEGSRDEEELISDVQRRNTIRFETPTRTVAPVETAVQYSVSPLLFTQRWVYVQGLVMAEVLGPPVSKRQGRGRRG